MAALRNLAIAILKPAGHASIAAACRYHARDATRVLATLALSPPDQDGPNATMPGTGGGAACGSPAGQGRRGACPPRRCGRSLLSHTS
jgi:hypothetical protein